MKPLLALAAVPIGAAAALFIAAATLWYIRRPHDREYAWSGPDDGLLHTWATDDPKLRVHRASDEDAIRWAWTRTNATGLNAGPWSWTA